MKDKSTIAAINLGNYGSTGTIAKNILSAAHEAGFNTFFAYPGTPFNKQKEKSDIIICSEFFNRIYRALGRYTGFIGCFSHIHTALLLKKYSKIKPDILHLHNIHSSYINHSMLFRYIKKHNITVVWTLHDCWAFTGQCAHFDMIGCDRWKYGCGNCRNITTYSTASVDRSRTMYKLKKKWFTGVKNLTVVTPSNWLGTLVEQSFLDQYPVKVINNGINLEIFKPTESDFRKNHNCENNYIVLGVAFGWGERKGLDVFIELAKRLDDKKYRIVLVGTDDETDKHLPENIISIHRTQNQKELAEIYTAANVFFNPTREENYPTVNMEALACGTPIVTFNTGGSPEITDATCGCIVNKEDICGAEREIIRICETNPYSEEACLKKAESFNLTDRINEYINLFENLVFY